MANNLSMPRFKAFGQDGKPLAFGRVYLYYPRTSEKKPGYTDSTAKVELQNPVILDANGEAAIFLDGAYKIILRDKNDVLQWTVDNYNTDYFSSTNVSITPQPNKVPLAGSTGVITPGWIDGLIAVYNDVSVSKGDIVLLKQKDAEHDTNISVLQTVTGDNADGITQLSIDVQNLKGASASLVKGYATLAVLNANLVPEDGTLADVTNDPDTNNNGRYRKSGATGAGSWVKTNYSEWSTLWLEMNRLNDFVYDLAIYNYNKTQEELEIVPIVMDEANKMALGFYSDTGELWAAGIERVEATGKAVQPVVVNENNDIVIGIESVSGQTMMDPHYSTIMYGVRKVGIFPDEYNVKDGYVYAIVDEQKKIAFGIKDDGSLVGSGLTFQTAPVEKGDKQSIDMEHNHFIFSGQSLSVGATGKPVISTSQPYDNLTFDGGPRSDLDELTGFKPLVEDENSPAPDGGTNRGETCCSGAANFTTHLIESEDGIAYDQQGYAIVSSTVGHGGYRIDQLYKGSAWYDYYTAHVQAGFDLSQAQGKTYAVQALGWIQGENDQFDNSKARLAYKNDLIQYQADIEADAQAITGQTHRVPLLTYQLACYVRQGYRNVTLAQLDCHKESSDIYLVTPMYHVPYAPDAVHLTNLGYLWLGHYFGKVYKKVVFDGVEWEPVRPKTITQQGAVVLIDFYVPEPPLQLDTSTLGLATDYGFAAYDNAGDIDVLSVELIGQTRVKLTLASTPGAGGGIRYALDYIGTGLTHNNGGSGNLRDSAPEYFTYAGTDYPLYNWCVMFDELI